MTTYRIPLSYNAVDEEDYVRTLKAYKDKHHGEIVNDFERRIADLSGSRYAVALQSGTAALHVALRLLNVGPNDTVLVSTFTYVASVSPVLYCGATPVFVDSESDTWNMDPVLLEEAIKEFTKKGQKPKAIILAHAYGVPAHLDRIMDVSDRWKVPLIEDAAEALGASDHRRWVGTFGSMGVYSFNTNKTVTTFGGGVLLMQHADMASRARFLSTHAREDVPFYLHKEMGYNYAMNPLAAAYGLVQLARCRALIENRSTVFERYKSNLKGIADVSFQVATEGFKPARWLSAFLFESSGVDVMDMVARAGEQGIELRRLWKPLHTQPLFSGTHSYRSGVSEQLFAEGICLPSYSITRQELNDIVQGLKKILN